MAGHMYTHIMCGQDRSMTVHLSVKREMDGCHVIEMLLHDTTDKGGPAVPICMTNV